MPVAVQYCDRKTKPFVSAPFIHTGCEFSYAPRRVAVLPRESGARFSEGALSPVGRRRSAPEHEA